ncbi:hypothetical protein GLYMA_10G270551v4 [Glycine max]|nr:hypothetical protein GLYMA_10G270551v4 [Glycine max]KAH1140305.1 hypothetical protein GYH30_029276 [Glycine max]
MTLFFHLWVLLISISAFNKGRKHDVLLNFSDQLLFHCLRFICKVLQFDVGLWRL